MKAKAIKVSAPNDDIVTEFENCQIVAVSIVDIGKRDNEKCDSISFRMCLCGHPWQTVVDLSYSTHEASCLARDLQDLMTIAGATSFAELEGKYLRVELIKSLKYTSEPNVKSLRHITDPLIFAPSAHIRHVSNASRIDKR